MPHHIDRAGEASGDELGKSESLKPVLSDPFEFARREDELEGSLPLNAFSRLDARPGQGAEEETLSYRVAGQRKVDVLGNERLFLQLAVRGAVRLECQRCLEDVACEVDSDTRLLLVPEGKELPEDDLAEDLGDADFDPIHAERNLDVLALIEDELLLALPIVPVHEECSVPGGDRHDDEASPFAVLGKLKRGD